MKPHHEIGWNYTDWEGEVIERTEDNVIRCLKDEEESGVYFLLKNGVSDSVCPLPCKEIMIESTITTEEQYDVTEWGDTSTFKIKYQSKRVTHITEIPAYTSDNFFSDVGSWLGLLVGMSFLSLVEIVTFIFTFVIELCS